MEMVVEAGVGVGGCGIGKLSFRFPNLLVPLSLYKQNKRDVSLCSSSSESRPARKCPHACWPRCQQPLKTAERGPPLPSRSRGNEFNMCGKQGCSLRCCGTQGPGPRRKAAAPACLCWVCGERTSGEEAPAAPRPPRAPLPCLAAESTWRQGAMSEHPDKTWAPKNV